MCDDLTSRYGSLSQKGMSFIGPTKSSHMVFIYTFTALIVALILNQDRSSRSAAVSTRPIMSTLIPDHAVEIQTEFPTITDIILN